MASIRAHEFISLDGVFESPTWTMEFGFDPRMGETIGALTGESDAILLGRTTYEMFAPAWRDRDDLLDTYNTLLAAGHRERRAFG